MKSLADMKDGDVLTGEILSYTKGEIFGLRVELEIERKALLLACNHVLPASVKATDPTFDMDKINNDPLLLSEYFRNGVQV